MIRRHNSEKIFLQAIDQQYDLTPIKSETDDLKFYEDYEQNMIDCLNMSTDSETQPSRQNSFDTIEELKLTSSLTENWKEGIERFRYNHALFLKNVITQKMAFLRGTLINMMNMQDRRNMNNQSSGTVSSDEEEF